MKTAKPKVWVQGETEVRELRELHDWCVKKGQFLAGSSFFEECVEGRGYLEVAAKIERMIRARSHLVGIDLFKARRATYEQILVVILVTFLAILAGVGVFLPLIR